MRDSPTPQPAKPKRRATRVQPPSSIAPPPVKVNNDYVPLVRSLGYHTRELSESWTAAVDREANSIGITVSQWRYLRELVEEDGLSHGELTRRAGRQGPTTVVAVRSLAKNNLVELRGSRVDRRRTHVFVTERGREVVAKVGAAVKAVQDIALAGLSAEELAAFSRGLVKIQRNLDRHMRVRNSWTVARTQQLADQIGV
jgi:DNA-binding MarR family transcriptional regulator